MSTEPFIGEVKVFAFNFAPKMYMLCQGQILAISNNSALFALLGTTYGGNGQTTFALPDLRGRFPISQGNGAGLPSHTIGEMSGNTSTTLLSSNMPSHNHTLTAARVKIATNSTFSDANTGSEAFPGTNTQNQFYATTQGAGEFMAPGSGVISGTTDISGSNTPINIQNPFLVMNYSIAIYGIFPSRN